MKPKFILFAALMIAAFSVVGFSSGCSSKTPNSATSDGAETTTTASAETTVVTDTQEAPAQNAQKGNSSKTKQKSNTPVRPKKNTAFVSAAQLTDEEAGKGEISMGDTYRQVKAVLMKYHFLDNSTSFEPPGKNTAWSGHAGTTSYTFDSGGKLTGITSADGSGSAFETSRGLKIGDTVAKMKSIYGKAYQYNQPYEGILPCYEYGFGSKGGSLSIEVEMNSKGDTARILTIGFSAH